MTTVIYYTREAKKPFRSNLIKLDCASYALCWDSDQRKLSVDPLETTSIYCNINKPCFAHLKGSVIFLDESVVIDNHIFDSAANCQEPILLLPQRYSTQDYDPKNPPLVLGIVFPTIPDNVDLSSHTAFKSWLDGQVRRCLECISPSKYVEVKSS